MAALDVATLIVYIIIVQPLLYVWWKHGRPGFLGWFYLQLFCLVRIIASIMEIASENNNTTNKNALLVSSIGLSPLILSASGLLHEARRARNPKLRAGLEWFLVISYHVAVSIGMLMLVKGVMQIQDGEDTASNSGLVKFGITVMAISWAVLFTWALVSLINPAYVEETFLDGTKLLYGVLVAMPFIGSRLVWAIISFYSTDPSIKGSLAVKIVLSAVPEMLTSVIFIVVGLITRNLWRTVTKETPYKGENASQFSASDINYRRG